MLLKKTYEYLPMEREVINGRRHYKTPMGVSPSITTILEATKTKEQKKGLQQWRDRIGNDAADEIMNDSANLGTIMHDNLEKWIEGSERPGGSNIIWKQGEKMADIVIEKGLCRVNEAWGTEVALYYKDKFSGTTDCVGLYNGEPSIIDFKTSRKVKKRSYIDNYMMQLTAYAMAHNEMFGTEIKQGVVMMCTHAGEYQEFVLNGGEFNEFRQQWIQRVRDYFAIMENESNNHDENGYSINAEYDGQEYCFTMINDADPLTYDKDLFNNAIVAMIQGRQIHIKGVGYIGMLDLKSNHAEALAELIIRKSKGE